MNIVEELQKVERVEDQVLIGLVRASRTIAMAIKMCEACRQADLGPDTSAICQELEVIGQKLLLIVGTR
jgi:hypothetical protein